MPELAFIVVAGFLGSSHCIGMCGPLAIALGANQQRLRANIFRQLTFTIGRIFTYGFLGVAVSYGGWWLGRLSTTAINVQAGLSIIAGIVLMVVGLTYLGLVRFPYRWLVPATSCMAAQWLKTLLTSPGHANALLAGVFTGFIPCGLVYGFLAYAASTGNIFRGWLIMAAFGLGTAPLMMLTGIGGAMLTHSARVRALRIAAWCVVVTGILSIARGAGYGDWFGTGTPAGCPLCQ
ncbi:MAG: sulfite exporter TauE/SafE family protein [Pirellulales bacterium]|nr:sulfite exporter TauE/SafE family protein [Pirellulales bacterium]